MQTWLILLAVGAVGAGVIIWLIYRAGSRAARDSVAADNAEVSRDQLDALTNAPKTPQELAEKLRKGGEF